MSTVRPTTARRNAASRQSRLSSSSVAQLTVTAGEAEAAQRGLLAARSLFVAVTLICLAAGFWLARDQTFLVKRVEVRGAYYLRPDDVTAAVGVIGNPIWQQSSIAARTRVMALGVPRDATVSFILPDTVVVALRERTAMYAWIVGSTTFAVSDDGFILGPSDGVGQRVSVVDVDQTAVRPGDRIDPAILREADYLATGMLALLGLSGPEVEYSRASGIVIRTSSGVQIAAGDDQDLEKKLAAAASVWKVALAPAPGPRTIDVRVPDRPIIR